MTVAAPVSANADPSVGASQAAPTGKQSMVIDLVEMIGSATAGSLGSPPPQAVTPAHGGTEVLGWIATAPPLTAAMCKVLHSFGAISPSLAWFATNRMLFATLLWYLTALSVDAGLRLSPTLRRVLAANVLETTAEHIARAKDTDMVRVEAHMTCVAEAKGGGAPDVVWTGKTVFPVGAVMDATDSSGGVEGEGAVLLEFTTQLEFADERSQAEFDKHMTAFEAEHMWRGTSYSLRHALVVPGVREGVQQLSYGSLSRRPLRASLTGFVAFSLLGLTLPYRVAVRALVPARRIVVVKRVSSTWPGRGGCVDSDRYPTVDYGA